MTVADELLAVGFRSATLSYQLTKLCAEFDATHEWSRLRAPSAAHWIGANLDLEVSTAREYIRIGKKLEKYKLMDALFACRRLSYSKVRTLSRFIDEDNEGPLCEIAERVPAGFLAKAIAAWLNRNEEPAKKEERQQRDRGLFPRTDADGCILTILRLPPLEGSIVNAAIDAEVASVHASAGASLAQQRADALVRLVVGGGANVQAEVVMHVRASGCEFDDGTPIADSVVEAIAPVSFMRVLIHDAEGRPINASSRQRHPTERQKRVVKERDRACVDCGSTDLLQYDHDPDFEISRRTLVEELFVRCAPCHTLRHRRQGPRE